jgi:pyruvate/2-oxoglutarate/acetoin dehydrogenase E1 component
MYAGAVSVPVVIRAPSGGGRGYGPTHSQSLEKLFLGVPHLKVVVPSLFHDPGQVFRSAAAEDAPVLFIEHKLLYSLELQQSNAADIHVEELVGGRYPTVGVRNYDDGQPDIVIFGYGGVSRQIKTLLRHLAEEEIRTLVVLPSLINELDMPLLAELASSAAAGCIFWEEGTQGFDWGAEVMAGVLQMSRMKAANMRRLAAMPTIIPAARRLEEEILPSVDRLEQAALELVEAALNC